jgi:hypothetical protein
VPVEAGFAAEVMQLFTSPVSSAIEASWKAAAEGQLPLPVEYKALATAQAPDDSSFLRLYLAQLRAVDRAAGEGFGKLLAGMGLSL